MTAATYREVESKLVTWVIINNSLKALIIIGSRARYPPLDIYADLDLILFARRPTNLSKSQQWLSLIAKPWITSLNYTSQGDPEWVLIYEEGLKIDLVISKAHPEHALVDILANSPYTEVLSRGYRILIDKTGGKESKISGDIRPFEPPSFVIFNEIFDRALISVLRAAKFTKRGDLWRAQQLLGSIRQSMLQFIEGHTLLTPTTEVDTWYEGRTIDNWADPKVSEKIPQLFPIHEQKEIARSLSVSLRTLNNVSVQIAQELHYAFPTEGQSSFLAWLHELIQKSSPIE